MPPLPYRLLADAVVAVHFAFVLFVVLGGVAALRWRWVAWLHLPAAAWGAAIELTGWICPLTPLENLLRRRAGQAGYGGGFIEEYLVPVLYPAGLTPAIQIGLGVAVLVINGVVYAVYFRRRGGAAAAAGEERGNGGSPGR
jgi:hypothetical protein